MPKKEFDCDKAEMAMRQAFDLFQLGASMLSKETKSSATRDRAGMKKLGESTAKEEYSYISDDEHSTPDEDELVDESPIATPKMDYYLRYANDYINFTAENPTTFHVVEHFSKVLDSKGFIYLSEKEDWGKLEPGLYYTVRNGTNLGAFILGEDWKPNYGTGIIGGHIDALATKLKPVSKKEKVDGYELLGVAPYSGALSPAWFDRDLGLAGRVLVKVKRSGKTQILSKLIDSSPKPIARISTLAPHFGAVSNPPYDTETKAIPVIAFSPGPDVEPSEKEKKAPLYGKHSLELLRYIASLANVGVEDVIALDLDLFDVQKGTLGGLKDDFIYAPRIDDRICSFAALYALLEFTENPIPKGTFNQALLYDNEEIGSLTRQGAKSTLVTSITERVITSTQSLKNSSIDALSKLCFANSIVLSADVTHLLNPAYKSEYLESHYPVPNVGITIALDPNGHMATDAVGLALVEELAKVNDDKLQYFQIKNNSRSGGTIGPSISSITGARTIDLGIAQLSMHSIRAATGSRDVGLGVKFFRGFYQNWREVYDAYGDL
jgi:aminopeptidase I